MLFWERFYELCTNSDKKPNTVCNELGFSTATATYWKKGTVPKGDALLLIADYFDCSIDYLLGRDTKKHAETRQGNSGETKLIDFYNILNDQAQAEVLNYVEYMTTKPENLKKSETKRAI